MLDRVWNFGFRAAELTPEELEPGEQVLVEFRAICGGIVSFNREGAVLVTNRRVIWLSDQLTQRRGRRVIIPFSEMKRCWLSKPTSAWLESGVHIRLRNFREYAFHAGSPGHVLLTEVFGAMPIHGALRPGDLSEQLFEAIRKAVESMNVQEGSTLTGLPSFAVE